MQTVWITKTVFTDGIYEAEFKGYYKSSNKIEDADIAKVVKHGIEHLFYKGDWHKTKAEAKVKANEMRLKKIKSLEKQIEKLKKLEF